MDAIHHYDLVGYKRESLRIQGGREIAVGVFLALLLAILALSAPAQNAPAPTWYSPLSNGNPNAAVKIEVYYDLQCPTCATYHVKLAQLKQKYGDDILITVRHNPLRIPAHDKALMAARVVEAANNQRKGWQMLNMVLANQNKWSANKRAKTLLFAYATRLRLNMSKFREDFDNDEKIIHRIADDLCRAKQLNITATPTVFLNGKQLEFVDALNIEEKIKEIIK